MGWQPLHDAPGPRHSSLHSCWPISSGGGPTIILCVRMQRCECPSCSRKHEGANVWRNETSSGRLQWQLAEPPDDGRRVRCSLPPCCRFPLESHESQVQLPSHVLERSVNVPSKKSNGPHSRVS